MTTVDFEAAYDNRSRVPEHPALIVGWRRDAAAFRDGARAELDIAYGTTERTRLDIFRPEGAGDVPLAIFFHGGYWRTFDRSLFSHAARGLVRHGIAVAIPSYDLCPAVTVGTIIDEARQAVAFLHRQHGSPMFAFGHSAGGHLAAAMLATDWPAYAADLPRDAVPAALAISGLFDLQPLLSTTINTDLRMSEEQALTWSPLAWPAPKGLALDTYVGGLESSEYLRQGRTVTDLWGAAGTHTRFVEIDGANHFTALAPFTDPDTPETARMVEMVRTIG